MVGSIKQDPLSTGNSLLNLAIALRYRRVQNLYYRPQIHRKIAQISINRQGRMSEVYNLKLSEAPMMSIGMDRQLVLPILESKCD